MGVFKPCPFSTLSQLPISWLLRVNNANIIIMKYTFEIYFFGIENSKNASCISLYPGLSYKTSQPALR